MRPQRAAPALLLFLLNSTACAPARAPTPSVSSPIVSTTPEAATGEAAGPAADAPPKAGKNHLADASSPYLRQHANNPVHWYQWGPEAFAEARQRDVPILLSVGYSTCHWCHVMAHESFEDVEIAKYINAHYVAIKVDREERPDIDGLYMDVVQRLTGRGGWPMTIVMTPGQAPFFGGTYFPARDGDRGASKGFLTILGELADSWSREREAVVARAEAISRAQVAASRPAPPGDVPDPMTIVATARALTRSYDETWGGFGQGTKFPRPATLRLLLQYYRRTNDASALEMVVNTLDHMARGGIRDHVGGGFHRYTTERRWRVPHFEKMLYDQAQLVLTYLDASQAAGAPRFRAVADDTLAYVAKEMVAPGGGFYSATDADSLDPAGEHVEGWFFTWTDVELKQLLGDGDAKIAAAWFDVDVRGDLDGRNILRTERAPEVVASALDMPVDAMMTRLTAIRGTLYDHRKSRAAPHLDDKILAAWNGLMISAFAKGSAVLNDPKHLATATRAARFVVDSMVDKRGRLHRTFREGALGGDGYLDDYAFFIGGLIDLFEATGDAAWLDHAIALQTTLDSHFWDREAGGYFLTSDDHERLIAREKPTYDGAVPAGNSVALLNLMRLGILTNEKGYVERAAEGFKAFARDLAVGGAGSPLLTAALDFLYDGSFEIFIIAPPSDRDGEAGLRAAFQAAWIPNRATLVVSATEAPPALTKRVPGLRDKVARDGKATAYVCERGSCQAPTSDPATLTRQLGRTLPLVAETLPPLRSATPPAAR